MVNLSKNANLMGLVKLFEGTDDVVMQRQLTGMIRASADELDLVVSSKG